ncbi:MAG TPA: hypothetical protein VGE53_00855 [Candidatus Paceibacterota bacterium]
MSTEQANSQDLAVKVTEIKESARRMPNPDGPDPVIGKFWFTLDVTALTRDLYVPVSISSGKKPTGFSYLIEGTVPGSIKTTDISCKGEGVTQITHGTIIYAKIPKGFRATFSIRIEMRGTLGKSYRTVLYQMQYKLSPTDTRYQKLPLDIKGKMEKFR